ncbi:hypothetical protein C3747_7g151 [Trypanosoma cruzi]|uniref:Uncharacterized protein n=2 Tax=Trypanosoma cruzi TaxID=5693 RepID=A0A2V2XI40_TRYCR|nr:hypothetical protein C3747_7g151 [Trypanosoma cruzi]
MRHPPRSSIGRMSSFSFPFLRGTRRVHIFVIALVCVLFIANATVFVFRPQGQSFWGAPAAADSASIRLDVPISSVQLLADVLARFPNARMGFERIYRIRTDSARLLIPPEFQARAESMFSGYRGTREDLLRDLENQSVVEVFNRVTGEMALFNDIRRFRPGGGSSTGSCAEERRVVAKLYTEGSGVELCDFCNERRTARDVFGRIDGKYSYTAANVAKLSKWHSLIITKVHDPLSVDEDVIADIIDVSHRWFKRAHREDPLYMYPNIICDAGKRASASQVHFHLQMALTRDHYFSGTEQLRRAAAQYSVRHGTSYWGDVIRLHEMIGLSVTVGDSVVFSNVCPRKEREIFVLSRNPEDISFARAVALALMTLRDAAGVQSFSFAISYPPLNAANNYSLGELPAIFRVIDRGSALDPRSDTGALEYFGSPYIAADPYAILPHLIAANKRFTLHD